MGRKPAGAWQPRFTLTPAIALGLSPRTALLLLQNWTEEGWLEVADPSRRGRTYRLSASYRQLIGSLSAELG